MWFINCLIFMIFLSFFFFVLMFLEWNYFSSCLMMVLGVICLSCFLSLGVHSWYSYFIILVFLSGILSMLTYFCSLGGFNWSFSYYYFFLFFFICFSCFGFFDLDFFEFFLSDYFFVFGYDFNYYYIFWLLLVLFFFLFGLSFSLKGSGCFRVI
uniref:NADH dehydrogenase subunit 6 n=1 Tax=Thelazia callipaeda TaxID=103827 RepID=A0A343IPD6_THECL|nr:NADH dehydrogenase subunit 6 [Thelazia callipaeda]